jgi:hypothetical protein
MGYDFLLADVTQHLIYVHTYKDELVVFAIEIIEMIFPQVFGVPRIDKTMTVWRSLDEHVWWQILKQTVSI